MTAFRLAHLSDPHLPSPQLPLRWRDLASKRLLSRFAWRRKRRRHLRTVLDALVADVAARAPDHVAITGDLTNFATGEEFALARRWLESLGDPSDVTVSPGNHDALATHDARDHFAPWRPWLTDAPDAGFPAVRVRGPVALVNMSSSVPTALHLAQGRLGADQLKAAREQLRRAGESALFRVVLLHHPPVRGLVSRRKALVDAEALRAVLAEAGAELVLHGHAHEALLTSMPGPRGPIPVMGVPSASTPTGLYDQPARWNEIEVTRDGGGFRTQVTARGITADQGMQELGRFVLC